MKHTPGPWESMITTSKRCAVVIAPRDTIEDTCLIVELSKKRNPNFSEDARLIAAAPELLAACKMAEEVIEDALGEWLSIDRTYLPIGHIPMRDALDIIRVAIAKAEYSEAAK